MSAEPLTDEHVSETPLPPKKATKLGKTNADSVAVAAWFDDLNPQRMSLWLRAKDGSTVCVPPSQLNTLKKLIRRGRNP